jgi:hypothetical protein
VLNVETGHGPIHDTLAFPRSPYPIYTYMLAIGQSKTRQT